MFLDCLAVEDGGLVGSTFSYGFTWSMCLVGIFLSYVAMFLCIGVCGAELEETDEEDDDEEFDCERDFNCLLCIGFIVAFCGFVLVALSFCLGITAKIRAINEEPETNIWTVIYITALLVYKLYRNEAEASDIWDFYKTAEAKI